MPWTTFPDTLGQGPVGSRGPAGGWTLNLKFSTDLTPGPVLGRVELDDADPTLVEHVYISDEDRFGNDIQGILDTLLSDDGLKLFAESNERRLAFYQVVSVTEQSGYWDIEVAYLSGEGPFYDSENIGVGLAREGPQGPQGDPGLDSMIPLRTLTHDPGVEVTADGMLTFMQGSFVLPDTWTIVIHATAKNLHTFEDETNEFYYTLEKAAEGETEYAGVTAHLGLNDADGDFNVPAAFTRRHFLAAGTWTLRLYYRSNVNLGGINGPFTAVVLGWPGSSV